MDMKYPIGKPQVPDVILDGHINEWIADIEQLPDLLNETVAGLTDEQLDTPYRTDGWTVRQVVHHLADAHMSAYINFRLGLTKEVPETAVNDVDASANLADARTAEIAMSLVLLTGLHQRWAVLLKSLNGGDYTRKIHSVRGERSLGALLCTYAWHGRHHVAHIEALKKRMDW